MTERLIKRISLFLSLLGFFALASCESNEDLEMDANTLTTEEALQVVLVDDISADVANIIEDDAVLEESYVGKSDATTSIFMSSRTKGNHPNCLRRTVQDTTNGRIVTLDFGEGCSGKNGSVFSGKIIISYVKADASFSKTITFENFFVDENAVEGRKTISKIRENTNGNPERTHEVAIRVTFATGETMVKQGKRVKEKVYGAETPERGDDVVLITGDWETKQSDGSIKSVAVVKALKREYACRYIVSGTLDVTKGTATYTVDFGDGSCDNTATITDASGRVKEITLRKKKK
ncbi:hypothetical protein [Tenacibaculum sp. SG-28]|uniref:hypothetical protein n=1 Tax=Tenacibaculum sp. SG-28 TaxID=754426 RepID=UPI000CF53B2D|nr:hypothetical protein [Tenacibaculum sp. SG-28]PQJ21610.1 hypothetical protein BSU00_05745 [Tenacibaculum sp. SG-28]